MSTKNAYIAKQTAIRQQYVQASCDIYTQYTFDCAVLVLHDEFGFGAERLAAFAGHLRQYQQDFDPALDTAHPECGYTQDCMDRKLREALREHFECPFPERYEWLKKVKI